MAMTVTSTAFNEGQMIPAKYTCDGEGVTPPLRWEGTPEGTQTLAILCEDPDAPAGTFSHWVLFNLPAGTTGVMEGVPNEKQVLDGATQGLSTAKQIGYTPPCPPGKHRYYYKVYALDITLDLDFTATREQLLQAMQGHILAQGELMGVYERQR